jgi:hypothetical protein
MVSILRTSLWHTLFGPFFDRPETHPTRQADVGRLDTIILPFFKDPLFDNSTLCTAAVTVEKRGTFKRGKHDTRRRSHANKARSVTSYPRPP